MIEQLKNFTIQNLDDMKAQDIRVLDVAHLTCVTDSMIICTGTSSRHVKSIAEHLMQQAKQAGYRLFGHEGENACEWILIDLGDIIVHVMQASIRDFYNLEKLWDIKPELAVAG